MTHSKPHLWIHQTQTVGTERVKTLGGVAVSREMQLENIDYFRNKELTTRKGSDSINVERQGVTALQTNWISFRTS
jgi:hypothetical protein